MQVDLRLQFTTDRARAWTRFESAYLSRNALSIFCFQFPNSTEVAADCANAAKGERVRNGDRRFFSTYSLWRPVTWHPKGQLLEQR